MGLFLREKRINLLRKIRDTKEYPISKLLKGIYITQFSTNKIMKRLREQKLIESSKKGRTVISTITNKGDEILKILEKIEENL